MAMDLSKNNDSIGGFRILAFATLGSAGPSCFVPAGA